jgi:hypothetical protein
MQTQSNASVSAREEPQKFLKKPSIAKRYDVCVRTIELWMTERRIPFVRIGKRGVRFDPVKCDAALARFEVRAAGDRKGSSE